MLVIFAGQPRDFLHGAWPRRRWTACPRSVRCERGHAVHLRHLRRRPTSVRGAPKL